MKCPHCQHNDSSVVDTNKEAQGGIRRRRECLNWTALQHHRTPYSYNPTHHQTRWHPRNFRPRKLLAGLRKASSKRPVTATMIEKLVDQIEAELQKRGRSEINSRVIGDLAVKGLKELDHIAYIRYAIVYLRMDDLHTVRDEIDHLLSEEE